MLPQFGLDAIYQIGGYTNIKRSKAVTGRKIYARLFFHSGMVAHPCNLDSGDPCRNDGVLGLAETTSNLVRFYVASLRETFFYLSRNTTCHLIGLRFFISRNGATLRSIRNLQARRKLKLAIPFDQPQVAWTLDTFGASLS